MTASASKLPDRELREFLSGAGDAVDCSVIVELASPPPRRPGRTFLSPLPRSSALGEAVSSRSELVNVEGHAAEMQALEASLAQFGFAEKPVRLNAAQAFAVTVNREQLQQLTELPLAGTIRLNRLHQIRPHCA